MQWVIASLNSIEPIVQQVGSIDIFHADIDWASGARAEMLAFLQKRLGRLSDWLGERD